MRPRRAAFLLSSCWMGGFALAACAAPETAGEGDGGGSYTTGDDTGFDPGQGVDTDGNFTTGSGEGGAGLDTGNLPGEEELPEEVEDAQDYRVPIATGRYLWSTNPTSGRVALIDAVHLSVQVLSAGLSPTYLAPVPNEASEAEALVINTGSSDVTRFIVDGDEVKEQHVDIHPGANRLVTSAHWAVAFSAPESETNLDPTEGLQEISVLALGERMKVKRLAVGYRPSRVQISSDERFLHVVSEEGITRIELDDDVEPDAWIDLGFDAQGLDVALSGDGKYALVREADAETIDIINLAEPDDVASLMFSGPVTDVDLSRDGRAVVVIRQTREVATFLLDEVLADDARVFTRTLPDEVVGSATISDDGKVAVLYSNVVENPRINVVQLEAGEQFLSTRSVNTQSPVYSVAIAPDGGHAVVLSGDGQGKRSNAFSVISLLEERFPRVVGTTARVDRVAIANGFAVVSAVLPESGLFEAHTIRLPALTVDSFELASAPLAVGALPEFDLGYVAQDHAEGRVTFFDFDKDDVKTLTGYELSAEVVDE